MLQPEILIFILAIAARLLPGPRIVDDAYITFRYAQNLLSGHGMVYNPGEAVLGTTTPVYALILAVLGLTTGGSNAPFPLLAVVINAAADSLTCYLLIQLGNTLGYRRAGLASALIWAIAPWSVTFAIGGMETSLFVLLTSATFYFHFVDRPVSSALGASVSLLTRPDALLFILPLMFERLRRKRASTRNNPSPLPISIPEVLAFTIPVLTWAIYGFSTYGNPVPHSILAKVAAYRIPPEQGLSRLLQHFATPFLGHHTFGIKWIGIGLVLFFFLFGLGALTALRQRPRVWPIFAYPGVYFLAYAIANPLIFRWYLTPPLPFYFLGIFIGGARVSRDFNKTHPQLILIAAATLLTLNGWTIHPDHGPDRPAPKMAYIQLELLYQKVAGDLREEIQPNQILAAGDIGALGYFTGSRILDTIGLISPQSLKYYPIPESLYAGNYAIPPRLITDQSPDYIVILEMYGRNGLLLDEAFINSYRLKQKITTNIYDSDGMLIFTRRSGQ